MARKGKSTGNVITIRRMNGLGRMGDPRSFMGALAPALLGGGSAGAAILAARYWAKPSEGDTPKAVFKWAPLIGMGVGALASLALIPTVGAPAGMAGLATAVVVGGTAFAHDMIVRNRQGEFALALPATANGGAGSSGFGVVVPQRILGPGTQGIVLEDAAARDPRRRYGVGGPMGEEVDLRNLGGVNPHAFGTPGFRA